MPCFNHNVFNPTGLKLMKYTSENLLRYLLVGCLFASGGLLGLLEPVRAEEPSSFEEDRAWKPPSPVFSSKRHSKVKRGTPPTRFGYQIMPLAENVGDSEICAVKGFSEPLLPLHLEHAAEETHALIAALNGFQERDQVDDTDMLEDFLSRYPKSRWAASLHLNLGLNHYETGWFSKALEAWHTAWILTKDRTEPHAITLANKAVAEYARMCARLGRKSELGRLFKAIDNRTFQADAHVKIEKAKEGFLTMCHRPGIAFRCGPYALTELEPLLLGKQPSFEFLEELESPETGFSLYEVSLMSKEIGLHLQPAKRVSGLEVVIPSVVHWKVGHFGALVRKQNGRYLLKDATFGNETWLTQRALDHEASGYFLIPSGSLPKGWVTPSKVETKQVFGKGHSGAGGDGETSPEDHQSGDCPDGGGMAMYRFHTLLASLTVFDTPVGYEAAYGPDVFTTVTFNQREFSQPATLDFSNFSPQWVSSWIAYLEDDPSNAGGNVTLHKPGGGVEVFTDYDPETKRYALSKRSLTKLLVVGPNRYERIDAHGGREVYAQFIGTVGPMRRIFLAQLVDPQGNAITLEYDTDRDYPTRLKKIFDATGLVTEWYYEEEGHPYLVSRVEDPFGRSASFVYTDTQGARRLTTIQDVYGILSSFTYDPNGWIDSLTTPYGTTTFSLSSFKIGPSYSLIRFIEATDPHGDKERIEYNLSTTQTGISGSMSGTGEPLPDRSLVRFASSDIDDRNSFYWNKEAMHHLGGVIDEPEDYRFAHLYHWIQPTAADSATSILESEKPPLEGRLWYNYAGQSSPIIQGAHKQPTKVARVIESEDGTYSTQLWSYEFNALANLTREIDPTGRETLITYDEKGLDLLRVEQKTGPSTVETLVRYAYDPADPPHLPRSITDGAGQTTTFTYRPTGQVGSISNAAGETVTYTYQDNPTESGFGRVSRIDGDTPGASLRFTYDDFDRVQTITESQDYFVNYDYDALDRLTLITYPDGTYEQFDYENLNLVAYRDRKGQWTRVFHNALQEVTGLLDPEARLTQFDWCRCGDIASLTDGEGNTTRWIRDVQGRVTSKRYPDSTHEDYTYDLPGRLKTWSNRRGQTTSYSYYADGNVKRIDHSGRLTPDVSYTYDSAYSRPTSRTDGIGTTHFFYHPYDGTSLGAGYMHYADGPFLDDTTVYIYDRLGRLATRRIVDDATRTVSSYQEKYTYDTHFRLKRISNDLGSFAYTYVGDSQRTKALSYPNGQEIIVDYHDNLGDQLVRKIVNLSADGDTFFSRFDYTFTADRNIKTWRQKLGSRARARTFHFRYDRSSQLIAGRLNQGSDGRILESFHYAYDQAFNRIGMSSGGGLSNWTRNELNQLDTQRDDGSTLFAGSVDEPARIKVNSVPSRMYKENEVIYFRSIVDLQPGTNRVTIEATDGSTNSVTQTYIVNASGLGRILEYDADGNLVKVKDADGSLIRSYGWDHKNRLISVAEGSSLTEMSYDGVGRRVRITERESGSITSDHVFIWCGDEICQKRNALGDIVLSNYYVYGFQDKQGSPKNYFYTFDHLGSIREVVASDGTTLEQRYDYSPFGAVKSLEGLGRESDFRYTGHYFHAASGLHLALYRAYDSELGRWISMDPIELITGEPAVLFPFGANLYAYGLNNPVNFVDDDGLIVGNILSGLVSVGTGYLISKLTGDCYSWGDAAFDFGTGAVGAGVVSKLNKLNRIRKLRKFAKSRNLQRQTTTKNGVESWTKGPNNPYERLDIKHKPGKSPNLHQGSKQPRASYREDAGKYKDPFTGQYGPKKSPVTHIPLEPPLSPGAAGAVGAGTGAAGGAGRGAGGCCD